MYEINHNTCLIFTQLSNVLILHSLIDRMELLNGVVLALFQPSWLRGLGLGLPVLSATLSLRKMTITFTHARMSDCHNDIRPHWLVFRTDFIFINSFRRPLGLSIFSLLRKPFFLSDCFDLVCLSSSSSCSCSFFFFLCSLSLLLLTLEIVENNIDFNCVNLTVQSNNSL